MTHDTPPESRHSSAPAWRAVDQYFTDALITEDGALVAARESCSRTTMPNAAVAANQGALLGLLVQATGARRVLEFGTLAGYSTIWLARAAGESGHVVTLELDNSNAEIARENFSHAGVAGLVDVLVGPAAESARRLIDTDASPFDFVFIDADKPSNPIYLDLALRLTRSGALILIDNVVRDGTVIETENDDPRVRGVRDVVAAIAGNPLVDATAIQTVGVKGWDGLIIARKA